MLSFCLSSYLSISIPLCPLQLLLYFPSPVSLGFVFSTSLSLSIKDNVVSTLIHCSPSSCSFSTSILFSSLPYSPPLFFFLTRPLAHLQSPRHLTAQRETERGNERDGERDGRSAGGASDFCKGPIS